MGDREITTITWVQDVGDGVGGVWQNGLTLSGVEMGRRQQAVAEISRVTSSAPPEDHDGGVVSYVRRAFGRQTEIVVEVPRESVDALDRGTTLTIYLTATRNADPLHIIEALGKEIGAARARGVVAIDLGSETENRLLQMIEAGRAQGCLAAPFTRRRPV